MLKTSLLTAAAAFVIMTAAPIASHAQDTGLRQIVIDPTAGGGKGDGSGGGTGGGGQNGTGGGLKKKPAIVAPIDPSGAAAADAAPAGAPTNAVPTGGPAAADAGAAGAGQGGGGGGGGGAGNPAGPAPVADLGGAAGAAKPDALDQIIGTPPAGGSAKLDAITGDKAGAPAGVKPLGGKPADGGAPVATAKVEAPIKSVDGLIDALRTGGFVVDVDHRDSNGDYYLVVTTPKDHAIGYLVTVDDKDGHVLAKKQIDPVEYGYYHDTPGYQAPKSYGQSDDYGNGSDDNSYGGGSSYGGGGGGGSGY